MNKFTNLFRPTMVRRVFLALVLAMSVAWIAVMGIGYVTDALVLPEILTNSGGTILKLLKETDDPAKAKLIVQTVSTLHNDNMRASGVTVSLKAALSDKQGNILFVTADEKNTVLHCDVLGNSTQIIDGEAVNFYKSTTGNWTIILAISNPSFADGMRLLAPDVTSAIAAVFIITLIAIWFAVSRGLNPLKQLSSQIATKHEDDLRQLDVDTKYAELKPVVDAINGLLIRLHNKVSHERAFVQDAAHELRTPMAVISAQAHVLAMAAKSEEKQDAEALLDQAIARASHLVQQMLKLALVDGEQPLAFERVDLAQLVRRELAWAASFTMSTNIDLSLEAPDSLIFKTESETFLSILNNLVDNAIRYGKKEGQIVVELHHKNNELNLIVADNGPGIAQAEHELVFERFYRVIGQEVSGSGLGLSIVRQAAARLGGKVQIGPGLDGKGCRFTVSIPDSLER